MHDGEMTGDALPGRVFFFDEWGSEEHAAEVAAGRSWFMVDRDELEGRKPLPSDEPVEWPAGWVQIGAVDET